MTSVTESTFPQVRWDLSALFSGVDDPNIQKAIDNIQSRADEFVAKYKEKINVDNLTAKTLSDAIKDMERIANDLAKPIEFAYLVYSTNTGEPKYGAFLQKLMEQTSEIQVKLLFFELELQAVPELVINNIIDDELLKNYRNFIKKTRTFAPYRLSEKEEAVIERIANTGCRAWVRLHDEMTANHIFKFKNPETSEIEELNIEGVTTLLRDPDRNVRQAAADALTEGLQELQRVLVFTYNNLLQDKKIDDEMRGYEYPEQSRHLSNELDKTIVDLVIDLCVQNYGLVERFYNLKREILGLDELTHIDRYAPLFDAEATVHWDEAKNIVLESFGKFSSEMAYAAKLFFDNNWIDAEPRMGKTGGAFCSGITPDTHPVVLMSYQNRLDDVMTLAHELGHGVHDYFASKQTYLNYHPTLPLAELASTFGEMLVFDSLVEKANLKDKVALYANKIEGIFATIFRQAAMFKFEQICHEKRRTEGELAPEEFHSLWQENMQAMFGNSVKLGEQHACWWGYIGHFVFAPFYVYAYSFGELLVLSLFQQSKVEGDAFVPKYTELLSMGGSRPPQEQMDIVGVKLDDPEFWKGGFKVLARLVDDFEKLWKELNSQPNV